MEQRSGNDADLVLLDTYQLSDVILDLPDRDVVVKRGKIVAQTKRKNRTGICLTEC